MAKRLILVSIVVLMATVVAGKNDNLLTVQSLLDSTLPNDKPIILSRGIDFAEPAGTVIFLSRKQGMERMVRLARDGEPELAMLFLPKWEAWITETKDRVVDEARLDSRYIAAAIASEIDVELWHTHNNIGQKLLSDEEFRKRSLRWTMPSAQDMVQIYGFTSEADKAKVCGVIANIYGITTYWADDSLWGTSQPTHVGYALQGEAYRLNYEAGEIKLMGLEEFARTHRGYINLLFEPVP